MDTASIYSRPYLPHTRHCLGLFVANAPRIICGCIRFLLAHPWRGPKVVWERLACLWRKPNPVLTPEGFWLLHNFEHFVYFTIFIKRDLAHRSLLKQLKLARFPIIVDVGANVGLLGQWLDKVNPNATFFTFEPCEEFFQEQGRILGEHPINCKRSKKAVSDHNGRASYSHLNCSLGDGDRKVDCVRLGSCDIPLPIFLLKIDTDGHNQEVLRGAKDIINACRFVLIEKESWYDEYFKGWKRYDLGNDFLYEQTLEYACENHAERTDWLHYAYKVEPGRPYICRKCHQAFWVNRIYA